jgi:hypothetical protein
LLKTRRKWFCLSRSMLELGHPIFLVETYRPQERQDDLRDQGITDQEVSMHTKRRAFDVAFRGGSGPYDPNHPWLLLGVLAEALGLHWGGRFRRYDGTHCEDREE